MELGEGKGADQAQVEGDYQQQMYGDSWQEQFAIDYEPQDWIKEVKSNPPSLINSPDSSDHDADNVNPWSKVMN